MPTPNDLAAFVLRASLARFHTYIDDLKPGEFESQPIPGVNSVAWILGHLTATDRRILKMFGAELPPVPDGFEERFKPTRQTAGEQHGLGDPAELVAAFDANRKALIAAVERADAATLDSPLPTPSPIAKNLGELAAFMAVHAALHAGQITVVRRALGYPPVM